MLEPSPENEQMWLRAGRQAFFRNRTRAIKDSIAQAHDVQIRDEAVELLRRGFFSFWDSLNTIQAETGGVDYLTLRPPSKDYWSDEEYSMTVLTFDGEEWSIGDFLESLKLCDIEFWPTKTSDAVTIQRNVLRRMIRKFVVEAAETWGLDEEPWFTERFGLQEEKRLLEDYYHTVLARDVHFTDKDIQDYFEANRQNFLENDMVDFGFILFPPGTEDEAEAVLGQLRQGGSWEDVGQNQALSNPEISFVPSTGLRPGDMHPDLARAAKRLVDSGRLALNSYSEPVQTRLGTAILRVTSRVPGTPMNWAVAKMFISTTLTSQGVEKVLQEKLPGLREKYGVQIVEEALGSAPGSDVS
jgi:hypothetical protein